MSIGGGFLPGNPFLINGVFPLLPQGMRAAYSQDIGSLLLFSSGLALPTVFFPNNPPMQFSPPFGQFFDAPFAGANGVFTNPLIGPVSGGPVPIPGLQSLRVNG